MVLVHVQTRNCDIISLMKRICKICSKPFPSNPRWTKHTFCYDCKTRKCVICSSTFTVKHGIEQIKNYCSFECQTKGKKGRKQSKDSVWKRAKANTGRKTGKYIDCGFCHKEFYLYPSRLKYKNKGRFCSVDCFKNWSRSHLNGTWKGDSYSENKRLRQSSKAKKWRREVFLRDNFTCVKCGYKSKGKRPPDINADHIKPWSLYPRLRFDINNGRTLCVPCHKNTESFGKNTTRSLTTLTTR